MAREDGQVETPALAQMVHAVFALHAGDQGYVFIIAETTQGEESVVMRRKPNVRFAVTQSVVYVQMCNQLLQHAKVIQNDQRVQPVFISFLSFHCITFIYFQFKNWSPQFISKDFISKHSGLFLHFFENIDRICPPPPKKNLFICNTQSQFQNNVVSVRI